MSANTRHVHILRLLGLHCLYYLPFMPLLAAMLLLFSPSCYALLAQARPTMQRILLVIATLLRLLTNIERVIDNLKKNLSEAFGFQVGSIGFVEPGHGLKGRQH